MDNDQLNACIREYQKANARREELLNRLQELERELIAGQTQSDTTNSEIRQIKKEHQEVELTVSDRYREIQSACEKQLERAAQAYHGLTADYVYQVADEKLQDCLRQFNPDHPSNGFRSYFHRALTRKVTDELRRQQKLPIDRKFNQKPKSQSEDDTDRLNELPERRTVQKEEYLEQLRLYARRKRMVLDQVELSERYLAILLIDQRRRMAAQIDFTGVAGSRVICTEATEQLELWSDTDPTRKLKPALTANQLWQALAKRISETEDPIEHQIVSDAFSDLSHRVTTDAWRQNVRRYRAQLLDQIDPDDEVLFLFSD